RGERLEYRGAGTARAGGAGAVPQFHSVSVYLGEERPAGDEAVRSDSGRRPRAREARPHRRSEPGAGIAGEPATAAAAGGGVGEAVLRNADRDLPAALCDR